MNAEDDGLDERALAKMFPRWHDITTTYTAIESSRLEEAHGRLSRQEHVVERETTSLRDHEAGDVLVVLAWNRDTDEHDVETVIELGTVLGVRAGKKGRSAFAPAQHALVHTLESDTLERVKGSWRSMPLDTPVVAVIARGRWLREMRAINARVNHAGERDGSVDPLAGKDRGGRAPDEAF